MRPGNPRQALAAPALNLGSREGGGGITAVNAYRVLWPAEIGEPVSWNADHDQWSLGFR
jgi:hypothetical protein